jgi:hypothetical protein
VPIFFSAIFLSHFFKQGHYQKYPLNGIKTFPGIQFLYKKEIMKYLFILFLFTTTYANAQLSEKQLKEMHDNTAKIESTTVKLNESINASMQRIDSENRARTNEQMTRNLNSFMDNRQEQERKNMKRMYWRLGFGILMLIVLVTGWMRKKKQKTAATP